MMRTSFVAPQVNIPPWWRTEWVPSDFDVQLLSTQSLIRSESEGDASPPCILEQDVTLIRALRDSNAPRRPLSALGPAKA